MFLHLTSSDPEITKSKVSPQGLFCHEISIKICITDHEYRMPLRNGCHSPGKEDGEGEELKNYSTHSKCGTDGLISRISLWSLSQVEMENLWEPVLSSTALFPHLPFAMIWIFDPHNMHLTWPDVCCCVCTLVYVTVQHWGFRFEFCQKPKNNLSRLRFWNVFFPAANAPVPPCCCLAVLWKQTYEPCGSC